MTDPAQAREDRVKLRANGRDFFGWTGVQITTSIEEAAGSASVSVSGVYATDAGVLREDDDVQVYVGDDLVLTGVVDESTMGGDAESAEVALGARSRLRDLVDCSAPLGSWSNLTLLKLLQTLVQPYALDIVDEAGVGGALVRSHRTEEGETLYDAFDRLSRDHSFLVTDDGSGRIVLTQAGKGGAVKGDSIVRGATGFLSGNARRSCAERYSEIVVRGQVVTDKSVDVDAWGDAQDRGVSRFRQLIIKPERGMGAKNAAARARWEVVTRAAKALEYTCRLRGWHTLAGALWRKNMTVEVLDGFCGLWGVDLLIVSVTYSLDAETGRVVDMRLVPVEAFAPMPLRVLEAIPAARWEAPPTTAPEDDE